MAVGDAIYDMPGLTFQGRLDEFWSAARPPDPTLFDAFRRVLAARVLIPGSFFNNAGIESAVAAAIDRIEATAPRPIPATTAIPAASPAE